MKRWYFLPVGAILALVSVLFLPTGTASAAAVCGQWDTVSVMGGEYIVQNNIWGATTAQCINVPSTTSTAWSVTSSSHNQGSVASYPSIYKGCHFGICTANSGMPIRVNQVTTAPFSWNVTRVSSGVWNIAAEAWFSPITDSTNGYNGGAELMIWLDYMGMQPSGSQVGTVSIAGSTWEVWYSNIGWNYIAYRRIGAATSINADLKSFINDSVARGYIQPTWYLHDLEAGTELMTGGAGFASNSFTFAVNTGTPPPTTPPPTTPPPTTPPPTTPPPTTPPPTTPSPVACPVGYSVNQWSSGFTADVKITNNSASAINGW
jgi:cellulose 1,4-beta-cellobiosidase